MVLSQNLSFNAYKTYITVTVYGKKSFLNKESDTKILQSLYFACKVGIISSCSNRIFKYLILKLYITAIFTYSIWF